MRTWFDSRTRSEQITLAVGMIMLVGALYFLLLLEPLTAVNARLALRVAAAQELQQRLAAAAREVAILRTAGGARASFPAGASLLSVLTASAHAAGVQEQTKKMAPVGSHAVSLYLDDVPFTELATWLVTLEQQHGIEVERISLEARPTSGLVSAQMTLQARGAGQ